MKKIVSRLLLLLILPCVLILSACGDKKDYKLSLTVPTGVEFVIGEKVLESGQVINDWKSGKEVNIYVYGSVSVLNFQVFANNKELEITVSDEFANGIVTEEEKQLYGTITVGKVSGDLKLVALVNTRTLTFEDSNIATISIENTNTKVNDIYYFGIAETKLNFEINFDSIDETKSLYLKINNGLITLFDAVNNPPILPEYEGSERYLEIDETNVKLKILYTSKGSAENKQLVASASEVESIKIELTFISNTTVEVYQA